MHIVTTIAGSDSGGGAGIQADLKTFQELKVFGTSVITALTAQNTQGVSDVLPIDTRFIEKQFHAILEDFSISALKTGMLFSSEIIQAIANIMADLDIPLIIDPVMIAKGGESLLQKQAIEAMRCYLLPLATVITPNIPEAEVLTGKKIDNIASIKQAAQTLLQLGTRCVVIKGGHLMTTQRVPSCVVIKGGHLTDENFATDYVFFKDGRAFSMQTTRIATKNTHGTGCTFSAALAAFIGRELPIDSAIVEAKKFIHLAITHDLSIGNGHGPTNHFAYRKYKDSCEVTIHELS